MRLLAAIAVPTHMRKRRSRSPPVSLGASCAMAVEDVSSATRSGRLEGTCSPPTSTKIRADAMEAPVTPLATQPRSRSITPPPVDLCATCLQATGSGDEKPFRVADFLPLPLQGISRMPGDMSRRTRLLAGVGTGSPAAAEVVEAVVGTGSPAAAEDEVAVVGTGSPVSALPASTTAPSAPSFAHSSESLAALPEPLPEVALVPPPPVDFSFSHSFLASLSMPGDKSVSNDDSVRPRRCRISTRKVLPTRSGPWPRQARRCQTSSRLPVPSSTSAMSPDVPDARVCAARTCPEGHAMIRFVDGCNDDYFCPQCDDCSDQF